MDYWVVREELRMYDPGYCSRSHVVALNKMDLEDAAVLQSEIAQEVTAVASRLRVCLSFPCSYLAIAMHRRTAAWVSAVTGLPGV